MRVEGERVKEGGKDRVKRGNGGRETVKERMGRRESKERKEVRE